MLSQVLLILWRKAVVGSKSVELAIRRKICALSALHKLPAEWTKVASTACKSNVEQLITFSTS